MDKKKKLRKITDEVWKRIPYADNRYEISNYGRIKSYCLNKKDGKIIKPNLIRGFFAISFKSKGEKKTYFVHKLTAEMFVPKTSENQDVVIHLDWKKTNNHYANLEWITKELSYKRMFKKIHKNNTKDGKILTFSKLTTSDVVQIKKMLQKGITQTVIAKLFCVSNMQITRIKKGDNWGEVKIPEEEMNEEVNENQEQETNESISIRNTQQEELKDYSAYFNVGKSRF